MRNSLPINQIARASLVSDADLVILYSQTDQAARSVALNKFLTDLGLRAGGKEYKQITTVNSNQTYTCIDDIYYLLVDASGAGVTINLPSSIGKSGEWITIKKVDPTGNTVTINPNGLELIDGDANLVLSGFNRPSVTLVSDGADWWVFNA